MKKVKTILYVEDEKLVQEELSEVLQEYCEKLYLADDGIQGLKYFKEKHIDIVISDIKMPFMDGIEMSKKIKEINPKAHIIFTTAFSDTEFFQDAIELQVDGYILKPINLNLLDSKITNVIESIELQKELLEKEQMLIYQSKLATMGEMIGNIAHQWRQPLSTISLLASDLTVKSELGEKIDSSYIIQSTNKIDAQVKYLSNTIDDFKDFFKSQEDINTCFNIKEFLEKCIILVEASFHENTIETIQEIDDKINSYGNKNYLTQALINILNNAKDALKIAEGIQKKLVFILTVKQSDGKVIIKVKDNAGGIPEQIMPHIFDHYFTTKGKNGTGLGLYISKNIIEKKLNGSLEVSNEKFNHEGVSYKGACFKISLPTVKSS